MEPKVLVLYDEEIGDDKVVKQVNKRRYSLQPMPPSQGSLFAARVARLISGALAAESGGAIDLLKNTDENLLDGIEGASREDIEKKLFTMLQDGKGLDFLAKIISMVMRTLPHVDVYEFDALAKEAMSYEFFAGDLKCFNDAAPGHFDTHFSKFPQDFYTVAIWAIKENSGAFFANSGKGWGILGTRLLPSKFLTKGTSTTSSAA